MYKDTQQFFIKDLKRLVKVALKVVEGNDILVEMYKEGHIEASDVIFQASNTIEEMQDDFENNMMSLSAMFDNSNNDMLDKIKEHRENDIINHWYDALGHTISSAASCYNMTDKMMLRWYKSDITDIDLIINTYEVVKDG